MLVSASAGRPITHTVRKMSSGIVNFPLGLHCREKLFILLILTILLNPPSKGSHFNLYIIVAKHDDKSKYLSVDSLLYGN
jgi:hypothetical protein